MNSEVKPSSRRAILALVSTCLLILGAWPTTYLASPRWDVWVVTEDGRPISDINVALYYANYSAEGESHSAVLWTDGQGHVLFPANYAKASLYRRVFYTISSAGAGVHASFGRHASVFAYGNGYEGFPVNCQYVEDWRGSPDSMQSKIIATRPGR
jgi:hypothetical protein